VVTDWQLAAAILTCILHAMLGLRLPQHSTAAAAVRMHIVRADCVQRNCRTVYQWLASSINL
jgi:hypothetical protein